MTRCCHLTLLLLLTVASLFSIKFNLFASEQDDRIEASAKESYVFKTFLNGNDITIQSIDGDVRLTGTVSERYYKSLARETVANLPGVKSVDNKLTVKSEVPPAHTDAWLVTRVKSTFLFHRNVNVTDIEVSVEDGVVTLRGEARSEAQKDLATEYAEDAEGVKNVNNEMIVVTAAMHSDPKTMGEKMEAVNETIDDASITALVKTTLLNHRSTSVLYTRVVTHESVVALRGRARNAAEKDLVTKLVSDVYGVIGVSNEMTVEGTETQAN